MSESPARLWNRAHSSTSKQSAGRSVAAPWLSLSCPGSHSRTVGVICPLFRVPSAYTSSALFPLGGLERQPWLQAAEGFGVAFPIGPVTQPLGRSPRQLWQQDGHSVRAASGPPPLAHHLAPTSPPLLLLQTAKPASEDRAPSAGPSTAAREEAHTAAQRPPSPDCLRQHQRPQAAGSSRLPTPLVKGWV